jgi:pimeloyl-ACP methyl ester carboxylesterase
MIKHRPCIRFSLAALSLAALFLASCAPKQASDDAAAETSESPKPLAGGDILSVEDKGSFSLESMAASIPNFFEHFESPRPRYAVKKYLLRFRSQDFDGSPVDIVAQFYLPAREGSLPLYVFASGTTGIGDANAPSLEIPEERRWGWYEQNMLAYASQGYVVMFPDYTGFHDAERPQRYFSKLAEGRMMLDAIRAAYGYFGREAPAARLSGAVFTAGYSQGGHAAMAAADLRPDYAPELPLSGVITYGSTNDVEALVREGPAYAPLIFYSYLSMYGPEDIRPADYLKERWMPGFEQDASTMGVDEFQKHYGFDYKTLYTEAFAVSLFGRSLAADYPRLYARLKENHSGLSGHGLPALVVQGADDFIVTNESQGIFVDALKQAGSEVEYRIYPGVSHRYTRMAGFNASLSWMEARMAALGLLP